MPKSERSNLAGPVVRKFRKSNDWTQKELAKVLRDFGWKKCDRVWVSRLESGRVILRDIDVAHLQAVFGDEFAVALTERTTSKAHTILATRSLKASTASAAGLVAAFSAHA